MRYRMLNDELVDEISSASKENQNDWLILTLSEEFPGYWDVEGLDTEYFYDFEDMLGRYGIISPARINAFLKVAEERRYRVAFTEDPSLVLDAYALLKLPPPVKLNSNMESASAEGFL